jgi:mono/diheme cytochrome c family protein
MNTKDASLIAFGLALIFLTVLSTNGQEPSAQPSQAATATLAESGKAVYAENCSACHQPNGRGIGGAFPPLAGYVAESFAQRTGRDYLPRLVLFGLEGRIAVKGDVYDGAMPPWSQLNDSQIAAVLNYIFNTWGNNKLLPPGFDPIQASDVNAARVPQMSPAEVLALRQKLIPETSAVVSTSAPVTFTAEQAERGQASYTENCENCHGTALNDGEYAPTLKGSIFLRHWENGSLAALYGKIKSTMPLDRPGELSEQSYVDVTAFLLSKNGYTAGDNELPADNQQQQKMSLKK